VPSISISEWTPYPTQLPAQKLRVTSVLGLKDVYGGPTAGAGESIRVEEDSEGLPEQLSTLRVLAVKRVETIVKIVRHAPNPPLSARGRCHQHLASPGLWPPGVRIAPRCPPALRSR
jgi:hypothetical protein